jgi:hypothetical protein
VEYTITIFYDFVLNSGSQNPRTSILNILNDSNTIIFQSTTTDALSTGSYQISITFTATSETTKIAYRFFSGRNVTVTLTGVAGVSRINIPAQDLTEQICISILEECDSTLLNDYRELENGNLRLLE